MNDGPHFIMAGGDVPEEVRAMMEQQSMALESVRHDVARLFTEQSDENLTTLRRLLAAISSEGHDAPRLAAYYEGLCVGLLDSRGLCVGCGKDHSKELLTDTDSDEVRHVTVKPGETVTVEAGERVVVDLAQDSDGQMELPLEIPERPLKEDGTFVFTDEEQADMKKYGLDDLYVEESEGPRFVGFACVRCLLPNGEARRVFISIADRKLRPEDETGCTGCMDKAKWG